MLFFVVSIPAVPILEAWGIMFGARLECGAFALFRGLVHCCRRRAMLLGLTASLRGWLWTLAGASRQ